jgi:hypothetical protein
MSEQLTGDEVARALNGAGEATCPICGREFESIQAMRGHLASHKRQAEQAAKAAKGAAPPARQAVVSVVQLIDAGGRQIVAKAVKNAKADAHILMFVAPHVGLAIAGQEAGKPGDEDPGRLPVRSRAEMAGELILEIKDPDVLRTVLRILGAYNSVHEMTKAGELVTGLGVAAAVDARAIPPDFKLQAGPIEFPIAEATIGDVVAEWTRRGLYEQPEPGGGQPGGEGPAGEHPPFPPTGGQGAQPGAEVVRGGVENT